MPHEPDTTHPPDTEVHLWVGVPDVEPPPPHDPDLVDWQALAAAQLPAAPVAFVPAPGRLLVRQDNARRMTATGRLHLPDQAREAPTLGTVLAVGQDMPTGLELGHRVWFRDYSGDEVEVDGEPLLVLPVDALLGWLP